MSRPIEQTLTNLIPRYSGTLSPELVELASSLLAQSRNKCSNLKADEEVARVYACANLACERLKATLNLPPIESRPPIPPRVYSKLYAYFDRTLSTSSARARALRPAATPTKSLPQRATPSKEQSFKSFSTPTSTTKTKPKPTTPSHRTPKRGLKFSSKIEKENKVPKWVAPAIRLVCKELETPRAMPHVLAGVESVLCLPCPRPDVAPEFKEGEGKLPALIASVWFFVVGKMRGSVKRGLETRERKKVVRDVLERARGDEWVLSRVGEGEEEWRGWEVIIELDVMAWSKEIAARGWKELDWYLNVEEGCGVEGEVVDDGDEDEGEDRDLNMEEVENDDGIQDGRGGGKTDTMHQAKYDYLSAKMRAQYRVWKEETLAAIKELQSEREDTAMIDA